MKIIKILLVALICSTFVFGTILSVSREMNRREYSKTNRELILLNKTLINQNQRQQKEIREFLCEKYGPQLLFCGRP